MGFMGLPLAPLGLLRPDFVVFNLNFAVNIGGVCLWWGLWWAGGLLWWGLWRFCFSSAAAFFFFLSSGGGGDDNDL